MGSELEPVAATVASEHHSAPLLIRNGAELVHLTEQLYVHFLRLVLVFLLVGCGLSLLFGSLGAAGAHGLLTLVIAALASVFAVVGLVRPGPVYLWLRHSPGHQILPAACAAAAVAVNGPDSPSWWVALPLLWIVAVVSSTGPVFVGAVVTAAAYLASTVLGGQPLIDHGATATLAGAVGLPVNTMVGRLASEVFARFVLRLHQLERQVATRAQAPVSVPNLAGAGPARPRRTAAVGTRAASSPDPATAPLRLTARQLEAALLARDGLRQAEIAACLGVSARQVERLLHEARLRTGAQTTAELVARLVTARLGPETAVASSRAGGE